MDKKKIQDYLTKAFLSEEVTPGIAVTNQMNKKNAKVNKDGLKAIEKDSLDYNKGLKQDSETSKMAPNKYNYTDDFQKTYHDEMEIMNGQEMNQYDNKPDSRFTQRAKDGIQGSSTMGNNPEWANVVPKQQGFEGPDFGKNLVKKIEASIKKRAEQTPTLNLRGADIQAELEDNGHKPYAIQENNNNNNKNPQIKESMKRLRFKNEFKGLGNALKLIPEGYRVNNKEFEMTDGNETYRIRWEGNLSEGRAVVLTAADKTLVNEDITRMKELFGYKSQDTLGLVKGNARINENKVFGDIWNKTKNLITEAEDIESAKVAKGNWEEEKMKAPEATKHVQGSVSTDKGTQAPKAKVGDASKAVSQAPEAKKHVESGASKGTATKPKQGNWDEVSGGEKMMEIEAPSALEGYWDEISMSQSADAKKHVQGSTSTDKGTQAPAPKQGRWEEAGISQAAEAKKHVHLTESERLMQEIEKDMKKLAEGGDLPEPPEEKLPVYEGEDEEDDDVETTDSWNSSDDEDDETEAEPTAVEPSVPMGGDDEDDDVVVPTKSNVRLLQSPSTGEYFIDDNGRTTKVPDEYLTIASDKSKKGAQKAAIILSKMESGGLYEYNEHQPENIDQAHKLGEYNEHQPENIDQAHKLGETFGKKK